MIFAEPEDCGLSFGLYANPINPVSDVSASYNCGRCYFYGQESFSMKFSTQFIDILAVIVLEMFD